MIKAQVNLYIRCDFSLRNLYVYLHIYLFFNNTILLVLKVIEKMLSHDNSSEKGQHQIDVYKLTFSPFVPTECLRLHFIVATSIPVSQKLHAKAWGGDFFTRFRYIKIPSCNSLLCGAFTFKYK